MSSLIFQKQKPTPTQIPLRQDGRDERPFLYNRPHSPGREIDMVPTQAPFYHSSINPAQYEYDPFQNGNAVRNSNENFEHALNHSASTIDDSNLKDGESILDGSDSYSGSDKSRDAYQRTKVSSLYQIWGFLQNLGFSAKFFLKISFLL